MNLTFVCAFLVAFGLALFVVRPDPTPWQIFFRAALILIGLAGLAVLWMRGRRR